MLFKVNHLQGIKEGDISLAFRKWKKPGVISGSLIHTIVGRIEILNIEQVDVAGLTLKESKQAGYQSLDDLKKALESREGILYKIEVRYHSPDPRISLRNQSNPKPEEISEIIAKLERMDKRGKTSPWTFSVLDSIQRHPKLRAADLAETLEVGKTWLKANVRKLKNLGLTVSHEQGYSLSPLGQVIYQNLKDQQA
jgi:predicted transcriptional regulator